MAFSFPFLLHSTQIDPKNSMMALKFLLLVALPYILAHTSQFVPSPGNFPATGDDTIAGGIFCIPLSQLPIYAAQYPPTATRTESPNEPTRESLCF
jgi:hypothetical protein